MILIDTSSRLPSCPGLYDAIVRPPVGYHLAAPKLSWLGDRWDWDASKGVVVSWADPDAVANVPTVVPVPAPTEEPTSFKVILKGAQPTAKIAVIKLVRELTNLGLKEAKDFVEAAPKTVKEGLSTAEATALVERLIAVGGLAEKEAA